MKSHIEFISTKGWSRDKWLEWRNLHGFGGSDIGTLLGLNNYQSNLELHLSRAGLWDKGNFDNFHSYKGHCTESLIIDSYWKYWSDSPESVLINAHNPEYIKKKCRRINGFMVNSKYPWLYASLDRLIPTGHTNLITGEVMVAESVLEAKNMKSVEAAKYAGNINPSFLAQIQTYLGVCELDYAELMILLDSTYPQLYSFERSDIFIDSILDMTKKAWDDVLSARELVSIRKKAEMNGDYTALAHIDHELSLLEPEVQSNEAYNSFLKERYQNLPPKQSMPGNQEQYKWAIELVKIQSQIKPLEVAEILMKNKLQKYMGDNNVEILDFAELGKVTWKIGVDKIRRFNNSVKIPQ